jgi:subtilisin family serine protease
MIAKISMMKSGEYGWWSASLYYAANNGAKVINMSEGG